MNKFLFIILTEKGKLFEDLVDKIIVTTSEGELTILKNHIPLIAITNGGRLIIFKDNEEQLYDIKEGVLKVNYEETCLMNSSVIKK